MFPSIRSLLLLAVVSTASAGSVEQSVLSELNLARTQPQAYAAIVASRGPSLGSSPKAVAETVNYLKKQRALSPLNASTGLSRSAALHTMDTGPKGIMGHRGSDGSSLGQRVNRFGRWDLAVGENIVYGRGSARDWVVRLIVDEGVSGRGHRVNIFKGAFRFVGIAAGSHSRTGQMMVSDFAAQYREGTSAFGAVALR